MNRLNMTALALIAGLGFAASAQADEIVRGAEVALGNGTVHGWARLDEQGHAQQIGLSISPSALEDLGHDMLALIVPLPEAAQSAGYDHIGLDWAPHGHPPAELFSAPHFDVHFYRIGEAERRAIDPADPDFMEKARNRPAAELMPANFMPPPELEPIPTMGEHWLDVTDPIFEGQPFEAVLIYGGWNGEMIFVEPMVTRDLLLSRRDFGGEVGQPARVTEAVSLPSAWSVSFDAETGAHLVSIDRLEARLPGDTAGATPTN